MKRPVRILHVPSDVGGNAFGLSRAERDLGLESDVVVFGRSSLGFGTDLHVEVAGLSTPRRFLRRAGFLRRAARRYDVFHFNFGQPILALRIGGRVLNELALLKRLGKTLLVTFQGCDVRPQEHCPGCRRPECTAQSRYRLPNAHAMLRHADRGFYLNPDLRRWTPGAHFLPYASVDPRKVAAEPFRESEEIVIAHAPTQRDIKGTPYVIQAVEGLRAEGLQIRLELLEGLTHDQVLARIRNADVVLDQLLNGWYGGFAVEGMAMAKPVLAYVREQEPADNPFGTELPIVRTCPATLVDDLRRLAEDPSRRREVGVAGRSFAERRHDPRAVARTVLSGLVPLPSEPSPELGGRSRTRYRS